MNFTFDGNEWFVILSSAFFFSLFWLIRKYFPPVIVVVIWVFTNAFVATLDYFLLATPFRLYYFGDNHTYEVFNSLFHLVIYPSGAVLFAYGYDKWKLNGWKTVWYMLSWTGFSIFYEWLCLKNNVLTYTGWKLSYSIPTYPISAILLILLLRFSQKKLQELTTRKLAK